MKSAKSIALAGVFTALLIGGQFVLSGISGIEVVTVLLLTFSYKYGVRQGLLVANAFSLLRCLIFGFVPNVLVLYLVYYNLFVIVFGCMGNLFGREYGVKKHLAVVFVAVMMTAAFTLIDDVITPLMFGFTYDAARAYFFTSFYTMVPQLICTLVTTVLLFPTLFKLLR